MQNGWRSQYKFVSVVLKLMANASQELFPNMCRQSGAEGNNTKLWHCKWRGADKPSLKQEENIEDIWQQMEEMGISSLADMINPIQRRCYTIQERASWGNRISENEKQGIEKFHQIVWLDGIGEAENLQAPEAEG
eukprot:Gb_12844 [translate_table: standard]